MNNNNDNDNEEEQEIDNTVTETEIEQKEIVQGVILIKEYQTITDKINFPEI